MARLRERLEARLLRWHRPHRDTALGRLMAGAFFVVRAVVRGFRGERIGLRAAALTYVTLFSLVPLMSVALGLLHALDPELLERRLREFIFSALAPGLREEGTALLEGFLRTAGSSTVGTLGFALLLLSSSSLLRQLDGSLNELWHVRRPRPLWVSAGLYALILLLGPVLAALSLLTTGALRDLLLGASTPLAPMGHLLIGAGRALLPLLALTALYKCAPNVTVRWGSALAGGALAAALWEALRRGYDHFAAGIFQYDPVYGALGALPLFLAWLYVSWLSLLSGARLAYAVEVASLRALGISEHLLHHPRARALVGTRVAQEATAAFLTGRAPPQPRELALRFQVTETLLGEALERMVDAGLVTLAWRSGVQPAQDPSTLTVEDVARATGVRSLERPTGLLEEPLEGEFAHLERFFLQADAASAEHLARLSWVDLAGLLEADLPSTTQAPTLGEPPMGRRNP
jgi:membrane protein